MNQKEIDGLTHFIDVLNRQDGNLTKEEQVVLETFFENAVNNQDLNKRISKAMKSLPTEMETVLSALTQVRSFCYKTRFINNIDGINKKIVRNLELSENNQTIVASEKIHLSEIGMLTDTLKSKDIIDFFDAIKNNDFTIPKKNSGNRHWKIQHPVH